MKLRLESGYPIFERCRAHGEAHGSSWWVTHRPRPVQDVILIVVLPGIEHIAGMTSHGRLFYGYPAPFEHRIAVMRPMRVLRPYTRTYPDMMHEALYIEIEAIDDRDEDGVSVTTYGVQNEWINDLRAKTYDQTYAQHYLSEEAITPQCVKMAEFLCGAVAKTASFITQYYAEHGEMPYEA